MFSLSDFKKRVKDKTFWLVFGASLGAHILIVFALQSWILFSHTKPAELAPNFIAFSIPEQKNATGKVIREAEQLFTVSTRFEVEDVADIEPGTPTWEGNPFSVAEPPISNEAQLAVAESQVGITPRKDFFGIDIHAQKVVFVIDSSGSMLEKTGPRSRLTLAYQGIKDAVSGLKPEQHFNVVLFADHNALFNNSLVPATFQNKAKAYAFLNEEVHVGGTTNLQNALFSALRMNTEAIIILSDGEANTDPQIVLTQVRHLRYKLNRQLAIYAIGFFLDPQSPAEHFLKNLTHQNNGSYSRWSKENLPILPTKLSSIEVPAHP
ncbi:MAG: VWA domain-containing protein [Verrucomicrobiota bacterium]